MKEIGKEKCTYECDYCIGTKETTTGRDEKGKK